MNRIHVIRDVPSGGLLNPRLYVLLQQAFGEVRVQKAGQPLVLRTGAYQSHLAPEVVSHGESYCVCCPRCGDTKFHLWVSYAFNSTDDVTGKPILLAKCWRCAHSAVDLVTNATKWHSMPLYGTGDVLHTVPTEEMKTKYVSPGSCLSLADTNHIFVQESRRYLLNRGIDPDRAAAEYSLSVCIKPNAEEISWADVLLGRIILPVVMDSRHVGWQARLSYDPPAGSTGFGNLRYISMPGTWRSRALLGLDHARPYSFCVVVEGPLDAVQPGPPCLATMGKAMSLQQLDLIASVWGAESNWIVVVGDSDAHEATERNAQELARRVKGRVLAPRLPHGDPGSWQRQAFWEFLKEHLRTKAVAKKSTARW